MRIRYWGIYNNILATFRGNMSKDKILMIKKETEKKLLDDTFSMHSSEWVEFTSWFANRMVGLNYEEMKEVQSHFDAVSNVSFDIRENLEHSYKEIDDLFESLFDIVLIRSLEGTRRAPGDKVSLFKDGNWGNEEKLVCSSESSINSIALSLLEYRIGNHIDCLLGFISRLHDNGNENDKK